MTYIHQAVCYSLVNHVFRTYNNYIQPEANKAFDGTIFEYSQLEKVLNIPITSPRDLLPIRNTRRQGRFGTERPKIGFPGRSLSTRGEICKTCSPAGVGTLQCRVTTETPSQEGNIGVNQFKVL